MGFTVDFLFFFIDVELFGNIFRIHNRSFSSQNLAVQLGEIIEQFRNAARITDESRNRSY